MSFPTLDRYELRRGLGRGAMGSVYLAFDQKIGREVAVKVLASEFASSSKHRTRFDREAKAIAALKHPNIVEIYDYGGSPEKHLYLVMEYIEGPHVGKLCRDHGNFPESVLAAAGAELAAALHRAHEGGIIHRDLKPENVFLDRGRLVLADFGIAKAIAPNNPFGADAASPKTDIIGTPGFMAPEQLQEKALDARTDLFAFGALLYYLATQKLPYDADSPYALLKEFRETRPRTLIDRRPELSEEFSKLVQSCLEVEPEYRPADAESIRKQLRIILDSLGAGDVREVLANYEKDPTEFRTRDQARIVKHMIEQLKIAVRDEDGVRADALRGRIAVIDPDNAEALRITGTEQLLRDQPLETEPEIVLARASRRHSMLWAAGAGFAALIIVAVVVSHYWSQRPVELPPLKAAALIQVRATDRTHVFLEGKALGATPGFMPAAVPSGLAKMEFVSDRHGRLEEMVDLPAVGKVIIHVDWKKKKIHIRRTGRQDPDDRR